MTHATWPFSVHISITHGVTDTFVKKGAQNNGYINR